MPWAYLRAMSKLLVALRQRAFESPRQQVLLNVLYTSGLIKGGSASAVKPFGLTWQQFNLMRILRGQRGQPASMRLLQERMLDPQSNASRLVDKLEQKGYVVRETSPRDRRRVGVLLTTLGEEVLAKASTETAAFANSLGRGMSAEELVLLSDLLDRFREPMADETPSADVPTA